MASSIADHHRDEASGLYLRLLPRALPAEDQHPAKSGERVRHVRPHVAMMREEYPVNGLEGLKRRFSHVVVMSDQRS